MTARPPVKTITFFKSCGKIFSPEFGTFDTTSDLAGACIARYCPESKEYDVNQGLFGSFELNIY